MKSGMWRLSALMFVLTLITLWGCTKGNYVAKPNEELYGTWTNESMTVQKETISATGYKAFSHISDSDSNAEATTQITNKWKDSEGNIWYKTLGTGTSGEWDGYKWQTLQKLSKSGTMREEVVHVIGTVKSESPFDPKSYPPTIDPKSPNYSLYYRAGN